ncbi:MAG: D-alanine--D-alanine ligase [Bacteroidales bacterium]|jgi:D-alanine-D-alanine ligase|nr:D-alanine--D-alanine ligase [Bacteroidales bacterium]
MKRIALLAGGNSGEFEISLKTAANIQNQLDVTQFETYLIVLKKEQWVFTDIVGKCFYVDKNDFSLTIHGKYINFDAVFIAIHGDPGENGKLQGYFEMLNIPYSGCDSFCSALTFNKYFCNIAVEKCGVPISLSLHFYKNDIIPYDEVIDKCELPCFVKPCNSGSSVGVSKAHTRDELISAITTAFKVDNQVMIERFIPGRELTCGVTTWQGKVIALAVTEIKSKKEYYDFEAKYTPGFLELVTPAEIDLSVEDKVKRYSELIYKKLGCKGVVRIDFILNSENEPVFLEINTIPGQTAMSIIPKQLAHNNISQPDFYANLIIECL